MSSSKLFRKITSIALVSSTASVLLGGYCYYSNDSRFFAKFMMPSLRLLDNWSILDAEWSHRIAVKACRFKMALPFVGYKDPESLVRIKRPKTKWHISESKFIFRIRESETFGLQIR